MNKIFRISLLPALFLFLLSCEEKQFSQEDLKEFKQAQALYHNRKFGEAESKIGALLKNYPDNREAVILLAKIKFYTKDFSGAEALLREYLENGNEENPYALMWLGKTLALQESRQEEALDVFRRVVRNDPENYMAHYYLGRMLESKSKIKEAIFEYQVALGMEYQLSKIHLHMGRLLTQLKMNERARNHYRKVKSIGVNPNDVRMADNETGSLQN